MPLPSDPFAPLYAAYERALAEVERKRQEREAFLVELARLYPDIAERVRRLPVT